MLAIYLIDQKCIIPFANQFIVHTNSRSPHRSTHHKNRRHANDLAVSSRSNNSVRHRLVATNSQLSIEVSGLQPLNGRLEISCLATIPSHVQSGEQFADYKTYSIKSECYIFYLFAVYLNSILYEIVVACIAVGTNIKIVCIIALNVNALLTILATVDIDQAVKVTPTPAVSDMAALGNSSSAHSFHKYAFASNPINFSIIPIVLYNALGVLNFLS